MARALLQRWESLPARHQVLLGTLVAFPVLFAVHWAFFPLLDWQESLGYALFEAVPIALLVTFATQTELARRAREEEQLDGHPDHEPPPADGG